MTALPTPEEFAALLGRDVVDLLKISKRSGHQLKRGESMNDDAVEELHAQLVGRPFDSYAWRKKARDTAEGGPFTPLDSNDQALASAVAAKLEVFEGLATSVHGPLPIQHPMLHALVVIGGYLQSSDLQPYVLRLQQGCNVVIGVRGSGKSTILNLLGAISASMTKRSDSLVKSMMDVIRDDAPSGILLSRTLKELQSRYEINQLCLFFSVDASLYALYSDRANQTYGVFEKLSREWRCRSQPETLPRPTVAFFEQGEVVRLAEGDSQHYLSALIDSNSPLIDDLRRELALMLKKYGQQWRHTRDQIDEDQVFVDPRPTLEYLEEQARLLELARTAFDNSGDVHPLYDHLRKLIEDFRASPTGSNRMPIRDLMDLRMLAVLYIGNMVAFCEKALASLEKVLSSSEQPTPACASETATAQPAHEQRESQSLSEIEGELESESASGLSAITPHLVINYLESRRRAVRRIALFYGRTHDACNARLEGLVKAFGELCAERARLLIAQREHARVLADRLHVPRGAINIEYETTDADISNEEAMSQACKRIKELYDNIPTLPLNAPRDQRRMVMSYDHLVNEAKRVGQASLAAGEDEEALKRFLFPRVSVSQRRATRAVDFSQLSFGQKSGLVLNIALSSIERNVVILDQPEDHLDAVGIHDMLAPNLAGLSKNGQVIIATHSPILAMSLPEEQHVIVLEARGDYGAVGLSGRPAEQQVLRAMLDILEGGLDTFQDKMRAYEQFLESAKVRDTEIGLIEGLFRRRTIDGLRNALQPLITNAFQLNSLRHEMKNAPSSRTQMSIAAMQAALVSVSGADALRPPLDALCDQLERHISYLNRAISDIRMLDTRPRPKYFDLGEILDHIRKEVLSKAEGERDVSIDISAELFNEDVYMDAEHLRLIMWNLLGNALCSTEERAMDYWELNGGAFGERITLGYDGVADDHIRLRVEDNGKGINPSVEGKLYIERCTTKVGQDHGLGCMIIKKLLTINGGDIRIVSTRLPEHEGCGTEHLLLLPRRRPEE